MKSYYMTFSFLLLSITNFGKFLSPHPLCVQMDFTRTFQTNTKCNNINHVWSHFYKILVVLKYHRRLWANIFDTDISRCINTYIKVVYLAFFGIVMLLQMSVSKILAHRRLWYFKTTKILQKWLQTWFILLHLVLVWNVRVKSIWIHNRGGDNYSCSSDNFDFPVVWICSLRNVQNY